MLLFSRVRFTDFSVMLKKRMHIATIITLLIILSGCNAQIEKEDVTIKDSELIDQYDKNKDSFQNLPAIAKECNGFTVASKIKDKKSICQKVSDDFAFVVIDYDADHDRAIFLSKKSYASFQALMKGTKPAKLMDDRKGFMYSKSEVAPLYSDLDSRHDKVDPYNIAYRKIDKNWYILRLQPDY